MMSARNVLLTGASGFIGTHLARRLVAEGWNVHVLVRPHTKRESLTELGKHVTFHVHQGTTEEMIDIVGRVRPTLVLHLASLYVANHAPEQIEALVQSNLLFGTQLLEAMKAHGVKLFLNTGTSWQHFENNDYSPVCLYAATKQAFEAIVKYYAETTGVRSITLKLFDTYGPDDPRPKLFTLLKKAAGSGESLAMSLGEQLLDLVYIEDVVDAFLIAMERLLAGEVHSQEEYAVSSGAVRSLRDVVKCYSQAVQADLLIEWGKLPYRSREVMVPWNKGLTLPGWTPRVSLVDGIKRMEHFNRSREQEE